MWETVLYKGYIVVTRSWDWNAGASKYLVAVSRSVAFLIKYFFY